MGILMYVGVKFFEAIGIDDPVGAVSVHGICGLWGVLSVGIFADGTYGVYSVEPPFVTGLLYGGGWGQLISQVIYIGVLCIWALGIGWLLFKLMDKTIGIRVPPEVELKGLDIFEHGTPAHPESLCRGFM